MVSHGLAVSGYVTNILSTVLYLTVTLLFYALFKPVSRSLSLIAALFSLAGCVFMSLGLVHVNSPISPLWFFGLFCLLIGYLILKSTFLPRVLGVLMAAAGAGWLAYLIPPTRPRDHGPRLRRGTDALPVAPDHGCER